MHFLEKLSDDELLSKIKSLAADERRISVDVLRHLREVEKRRLFAALGYSSLYAYVTQELGYDEGGAVLRISSARLMADIPETEEPLRTGRLNVSTMNQAQRFFRAEKEERGKEYTPQEKRDLLQSIEGCSKLETAQKLAELSPGANHKVRLSLLVTPELMSKLKSLQGLLAHSGADQSFEKLIEMMADQTLKKLEKNFGNAKNTEAKSKANPHTDPANADKKTEKATEATSAQPVPEHEAVRQNIPASLQKQVRLRDGNRCTFVSPINGKKCHSSHAIEIDHIIPVARGGTNVLGNLRCLCRTHNQYAAIRIFGEDKMSQYVPDLSSTQSASRFSS